MATQTFFGPVLVVEFSTGFGIFCADTRRAIASIYNELDQVVELCNGREWLIVGMR